MKEIAVKDTEQTVQYVQSDRGLFIAATKFKGYENSAGPDLPMHTSEQSLRSFVNTRAVISAEECTQYW